MATDKGKCLVWIFHGGFHICTGLQLSIFCHLLEEINLGPERAISILFDAVTDGTWRRDEVPYMFSSSWQICKGHCCTLAPLMRFTAHM